MVDDAPPSPLAPCQVACPAGTDAGRYVGLVAAGRYDEAYAVAAEVNPFPSVCGWICTAPCEVACRRDVLDEPIAIRTLKRFAVEHGHLPAVPPPAVRRSERVAIVGGGPAGMSAAYYLARLGYAVTVLEAMPIPGGMMAIGIPEYRLPREVLQAEIKRIVDLGRGAPARHRDGPRLHPRRPRARGLPGRLPRDGRLEEPPARRSRRRCPRRSSRRRASSRRSTSARSPRLSGPVVVVGGGSTAMDAARSAIRSGAASVTVVYRRGREEMPAQAEEIEEAVREGVTLLTALAPLEVVARDGVVVALRCEEQQMTGSTEGGRRVYAAVPGCVREVPASTILVAIGEEPDPSILPEGAGIEVSGWAGIVADPRTLATGRAGIFAGGDVVSGPKTIIDAVAAGRRAAASIHEHLAGVRDGEAEILATVRFATPPEARLTLDLGTRPRAHAPLPVVELGSFAAHQVGFDEASARAEAAGASAATRSTAVRPSR